MCGEGVIAAIYQHFVGVAMVGSKQHSAACCQHGVRHLAHGIVHGLHSFYRSAENAGVAHHVAVGKVENDHIVLAAFNALYAFLGHQRGAHLGLQVISGHLGAGDHAAVFARVRGFHTAVEKEGDMGVFFGFGNAKLRFAVFAQILAQHIGKLYRGISHLHIGHGGIILCHAHIMHREAAKAALEACESIICENAGHLAGTVRAEVHKDHGIALLHAAALTGHARDHEFIGHIGGVAGVNALLPVYGVVALAVNKGGVGLFLAVPVAVTVHCVVAAGHCGDPAQAQLVDLGLQVAQKALAVMRIGVTAVHDAVQIQLLYAHGLGHFHHAEPMIAVAVYAALAHKAHQVNCLAGIDGSLHVAHKNGVFQHFSIVNAFGNQGELLINDAARTHVGVAHLAVAHLPIGQAHIHAAGTDGGAGILRHQTIDIRLFGGCNGVAAHMVGHPAKAVHNAK